MVGRDRPPRSGGDNLNALGDGECQEEKVGELAPSAPSDAAGMKSERGNFFGTKVRLVQR